jgi:hypothetical protein
MNKSLEPALHDIFKLVDVQKFRLRGHGIENPERLEELGLPIPSGATWQGIRGHHVRADNVDLFLLILADHAASGASRAYSPGIEKVISSETVHRLWNPAASRPLKRIGDIDGLRQLVTFLEQEPSEEAYFKRYEELLLDRAEDQGKPLDVVSLYVHSRLVGKFYRFFKEHTRILQPTAPVTLEFAGRKATNTPKDAEANWAIRWIYGEVGFDQEPIRARDLNVFPMLAQRMEELAAKDNVLFYTSAQFLAVLPPGEDAAEDRAALQELLESLLKDGFHVDIEEAHVPIRETFENPLPGVMRDRARPEFEKKKRRAIQGLAQIPDPKLRAEKIAEQEAKMQAGFEAEFPQDMVYPLDLPQRFGASICAVCQMEEGTVEWPKQHVLDTGQLCAECQVIVQEEEWPPDPELLCESCAAFLGDRLREGVTKETLGPRCYALRQQGIRLGKLNKWTDEPGSRVVWLKVALDMPLLVKTLEELYSAYVQSINPELGPVDVRLSLVAEFQRDYETFLRALNTAIVAHFGEGNVEQVFALPESAMPNDLFCVKVGSLRDALCLLKIYQDLMYPARAGGVRFFCPHQVHKTMPAPFFPAFAGRPASPIRVAVSCSHARFPFFQHWRLMRVGMERADVYVNVVGKGEITASLEALAPLLLKADFRRKRAFYTLAQIGRVSEQLAKLKMHFRGDRDRWTYKSLREDLLPLGLSYQSILTLAKIMGD